MFRWGRNGDADCRPFQRASYGIMWMVLMYEMEEYLLMGGRSRKLDEPPILGTSAIAT